MTITIVECNVLKGMAEKDIDWSWMVLDRTLAIRNIPCLLYTSRPSMRHPYGGTTAYPVPGRFLLPFGPYGGVLRLGDSPLAGREKAVGDGGSAGRCSHRILADVPLCPLPDGYSGWCHFGSCLWMGGSMARKESRATNGHPAELKKKKRPLCSSLLYRGLFCYEADPLI